MLKFGEIIDETLFGPRKKSVNPCVELYGEGPKNKRCKHCRHFIVHQHGNRYFKCAFRKITHGPATDHRANWPTCGKYEPDTREM